jgi:glyoxylase-like metal-dependent hydrolase (beta-lactamase superfamily II)
MLKSDYQCITCGDGIAIHRFGTEEKSNLIEFNGHSILIDCHTSELNAEIKKRDLPMPEIILHTHVAPEHCCEGNSFGDAVIRVPKGLEVLASDPVKYSELTATVWDNPEEWMDTMGRETYGVGGCTTFFPPATPLVLGESLQGGDSFSWNNLFIEVIALPAHGLLSIGFIIHQDGNAVAFFPGDLFRHPANLVNMYELVANYGGTCISQLPLLLRKVSTIGTKFFFPSTGDIMNDGPAEAEELAIKIENYLKSLSWKSGNFTPSLEVKGEEAGAFIKVADGIYQDKGFGNTIILIDKKGRGLVIDPGPCGFGNDILLSQRESEFSKNLDFLEKNEGLKTVELMLITHMHGDHYDMVPLLKQRYGAKLGSWCKIAEIIENPEAYPYSCMIPWYNLGINGINVDYHLQLGIGFDWNGIDIEVIHLPGHCYAHCGYIFDFRGERLAITGDTIQSRGESCSLSFIITNDSEPFSAGVLHALQNLCDKNITLNLGGHGSRFRECNNMYKESILRVRKALDSLEKLLPDENYHKLFHAPNMR